MDDIRHKIKGFLKNHAAAITAGFLMTAAVAAGLLQAGTTSVSAGPGIGSNGKSGGVSYKKGNCPVSAIGPEISVTPRIYDYGPLINTDAKGNDAIETYDQKKKVAKEEGSGHGWDVHDNPTKKTEDKLLYIANNTRHNMVSTTISNREDHYSNGSLIFVPVGTGKGFGNHHAYTQKVDDGTAKSKSDVSKKHLIFGSVDDGIEGFIGGIPVKGNADSQRDYNKDHVIQQKVIGEKSNGIFMHLIRDMEKEKRQRSCKEMMTKV